MGGAGFANDRPISSDLFRRFWRRAGGGRILQEQHADAGRRRLENSVLDFAEFNDRLTTRIKQIEQIVVGEFPARDIAHEREQVGAVGVEFDLEACRALDRS